jgi:predicted metal-dependent HD superfamily phosphohydrolase
MFETEYQQTLERMGLPHEGFLTDLIRRYREPGRYYHTDLHIRQVLGQVKRLAIGLEGITDLDLDVIRFAVFYHDAVYVPGFAYNEELSAYMAESHLLAMGNINLSLVDRVNHLIMATKTHIPKDIASALIVDADLYGLGSASYWSNGDAVRREFGKVTDEDWRAGRTKFLESFLAREHIFHIPGQDEWEARARSNMQEELDELTS